MEEMTKGGLVQFVDMMTTKGWINSNTGNAMKAALKKVAADIPDSEDVRQIDVKMAVLRYNNLHPGDLSPESLKAYEQRVRNAIDQFIRYKTDPTNYKPPSRGVTNGKTEKPDKAKTKPQVVSPPAGAITTTTEAPKSDVETKTIGGTATGANLVLPFPIRPGHLAQIMVPIDMTAPEADRLSAFIKTLAQVAVFEVEKKQ